MQPNLKYLWFNLSGSEFHSSLKPDELSRTDFFFFPHVLPLQNSKALKAKKEEGNKAFKEGNFEAAYELYSEALTIDPNNIKTNAKLYCNRATVGSKVRNARKKDLATLFY